MDKNDSFDNNLKSAIDINDFHIEPSRNIFEESWLKKDEKVIYKKHDAIRHVLKAAMISICCITLITFILSSNVRTFAKETYNSIKTIFILEKSGSDYKVVEKSGDTALEYENIGGITVNEQNRKQMENRIGFSLCFPEKIGEEFRLSHLPTIGATVYQINIKEIKALEDKFMKTKGDDEVFKELNNYKNNIFIISDYSDLNGNTYLVYMSKNTDSLKATVIKEAYIENMKCKIVEINHPVYPLKKDGRWTTDDITQKPTSIVKRKYIIWNYNGITYSITTPSGDLDLDASTKFIQGYIKSLKQQ